MCVGRTEHISGYDQQIVTNRFSHELRTRTPRSFQKQIECTLTTLNVKVCLQETDQHFAFPAIVVHIVLQIEFPRGHSGPLNRMRRTHEGKLLKFQHLLDEILRTVDKSQPQAGH